MGSSRLSSVTDLRPHWPQALQEQPRACVGPQEPCPGHLRDGAPWRQEEHRWRLGPRHLGSSVELHEPVLSIHRAQQCVCQGLSFGPRAIGTLPFDPVCPLGFPVAERWT